MTVSVESEPTHRPGSRRENLGNSMFLKPWTHFSAVYSPKTLYTVEFLFGTFFIQSVGKVLPHFLRLFCIF